MCNTSIILEIHCFNLLGIRTVYQNRYCGTRDKKWSASVISVHYCAENCRGKWNQFRFGTGNNCDSAGRCHCYCYLKYSTQCTSWEVGEYIQYAFSEPGTQKYLFIVFASIVKPTCFYKWLLFAITYY